MYPEGGYKTVTPVQIANALADLERGAISFRGLRVYLGCFELQACREAAARVRSASHRRDPARPCYRSAELLRLMPDIGEAAVRSELRRLERARLVVFTQESITITETPFDHARPLLAELCSGRKAARPIPVPRRLLVFLCRCRKPALVKTLLGYLVRGLSLERETGEVKSAGTVKATWIARVFGLSERGARAARAELIRLGVISKDEGSHQWKLNRDGAYFRVNLSWEDPARSQPAPVAATLSRVAPPRAEMPAESAPPRERPVTPSDLKDQKLAACERAGFCGRKGEVTLRDIRPEDIRRLPSLRKLYEQAVQAGWLDRSEAQFLAFAAAAVRANRVGADPVRVFVAIVRRGLWHHVTNADEDRARVVISRDRASSEDLNSAIQGLLRRAA